MLVLRLELLTTRSPGNTYTKASRYYIYIILIMVWQNEYLVKGELEVDVNYNTLLPTTNQALRFVCI